jgi:hypothetical protein
LLVEVALGFVPGVVEGEERRPLLLLGLVEDMRGDGGMWSFGVDVAIGDVRFGVGSWGCGEVAVESS